MSKHIDPTSPQHYVLKLIIDIVDLVVYLAVLGFTIYSILNHQWVNAIIGGIYLEVAKKR